MKFLSTIGAIKTAQKLQAQLREHLRLSILAFGLNNEEKKERKLEYALPV